MLNNFSSLNFFLPELALIVGIVALLLGDLFFRLSRLASALMALTFIVIAAGATAGLGSHQAPLFYGLLITDGMSQFFKVLFYLATAIVVIISTQSAEAIEHRDGSDHQAAEYNALLLALNLGMNLMAGANDLFLAYLSLEMVSLFSYIAVGFRRRNARSSEAALKYIIYGGVASGVMLFGFSLLYGATGATTFSAIRRALVEQGLNQLPLLIFSVICVLAGLGYKIAAVPFHQWCPDAYEGAPTPVTAFLSVGPKAAGFALLLRFFAPFTGPLPGEQEMYGVPWALLLGVLAAATMTLGNFAALWQNNVKRLLAYSSIAHAGYLLMGLCVLTTPAQQAVMFYLVAYLLMNLGAFIVVIGLQEAGISEQIENYRGLGTRAPILAVTLAIFLFSLTGIPPMAGFVGKFYLFAAVLQKGGPFYYVLAVVGILNSALSLFYYARLLKEMFFNKSDTEAVLPAPLLHRTAAVSLAVPTIALGIYWSPLVDLITRALHS